tara:strand:+ start:128 stop:337 length:210 start_codon:yes stop_codon:yes gene_type:complete
MNLKDELQPLLNAKPYKGKSIAEVERIAGLGNGTLHHAFKANSIRTGLLNQLAEPTGKKLSLIFKKAKS